MNKDYLTPNQVAVALNHSHPFNIRNYCRWGKIPGAKKIGGRWYIPAIWLENELKSPTLIDGRPRYHDEKRAKQDSDNPFFCIRKKYKLSLQDFAEITGIHVNSLGRYEKGTTQPTIKSLEKINAGLARHGINASIKMDITN